MEKGILTPKNAQRLLQGHVTPEVRRLINMRYGEYRSDREIALRLGKTCQDVRHEFDRLVQMAAICVSSER